MEPEIEDHRRSFHKHAEPSRLSSSSSNTDGQQPARAGKKSSSIMSRISMFDNDKKPLHLPVKAGSPVISRTKLQHRRETFSSHSRLPEAPLTKQPRTISMPSPPVVSGPLVSLTSEDETEETTTYEGPLVDEPPKRKSTRESSVQKRLLMFEKKSQDSSQSAHVRRNNSDGMSGMLSPKLPRKDLVTVKSTDTSHFASPQHNRRLQSIDSRRDLLVEELTTDDLFGGRVGRRRSEVIQSAEEKNAIQFSHSFHGFNRPEYFDSPSSYSQKRTWREKKSGSQEIPTVSHQDSASIASHDSDDSGEFASEKPDVTKSPNWRKNRRLSSGNVASAQAKFDGNRVNSPKTFESQRRFSASKKPITSSGEPTLKISTKSEREEKEASPGKIPISDETTTLKTDGSEPLTPAQSGNAVTRKSSKLQDRINMFNKATSPQPAFLNSHYTDKLVQKETKKQDVSGVTLGARQEKPRTSIGWSGHVSHGEESKIQQASDPASSENDKGNTPRISLDKAAEAERNRAEVTPAKHMVRRGQLKAMKSALVGQKNKDKNAVVAATLAHDQALDSFKMPEFPKEKAEAKIIITALRKNFVFEDMGESEIATLVTAMEEVKVPKDTDIIKQGDHGDYFYVVSKGEVAFIVDGRKVGVAGPGNGFGHVSLLYNCPRIATVRAESEPTALFRIDQKTFRYMTQSQSKKSEEDKKQFLKHIPFLANLSAEDISKLCSVMKPILFSTGDYIVQKGDSGSSFFIIQDGKVRLTEIFVGGTSYEDITLGKGDYFGEDALVSNEPRAANVVALTKGSAFSIDRASVRKVLGDFASLISKAQDRQRLESMKIFRDADLTADDFDNLAKLFTDKKYRAHKHIFEKNRKVLASLYIVRQGAVKITSANGHEELIGVGGAFGQDQLLIDAQCDILSGCDIVASSTATAVSDCVCGVLTLSDCRSAIDTRTLGDGIFSGKNSALEQKRAAVRELVQSTTKLDDLDKEKIIGEGQFGTVWLVRADPHKTKDKRKMLEFAMKVQYKEDPVRKDGAIEAIKREMTVIHQLNHPFIIDLVDKYETDDQLMMLTEAVKGGELWSRIHREDSQGNWESGMPEAEAKFYALVIADTVAYMHRQKIIFRDLKPENVLIDAEGYPTLCDFGFAKYCPDKTYTFCGTPNYLAPEIVLNRGHGAAVDHWALGIVAYEMITGENPFYFDGQDQMALLQAIVQEPFYPLPESVSGEVKSFMAGLLEKDPVQRLGSLAGGEKGILKHEWFSELDINQVRNKKTKAPYIPKIENK